MKRKKRNQFTPQQKAAALAQWIKNRPEPWPAEQLDKAREEWEKQT